MDNGWYSEQELEDFGFAECGQNVLISKKTSIYGAKNIFIGSNVRIDDFCIIAASNGILRVEGYNHISAFCYLNCSGGITMEKFSGLSSRCSLYSSTDNYDGSCLTNPTVPNHFLEINQAPIILHKHVIIGNNSSVLPGCVLGLGSAVGAFSLVNKSIPEFKIAVGIPAKPIKDRKRDLIQLELKCLNK